MDILNDKPAIARVLFEYFSSNDREILAHISDDKYIEGLYLLKNVSAYPVLIENSNREYLLVSAQYLYDKLQLLGYYYDRQFKKWSKFQDTPKSINRLKGF